MLGIDSLRALIGRKNRTLPADVSAAIEAAWIMERSSDQDGAPRVAVSLGGGSLVGAFIFSEDEAQRRLERRFPDLTPDQAKRGVRYLAARVTIVTAEQGRDPDRRTRKSWLNRYRYPD